MGSPGEPGAGWKVKAAGFDNSCKNLRFLLKIKDGKKGAESPGVGWRAPSRGWKARGWGSGGRGLWFGVAGVGGGHAGVVAAGAGARAVVFEGEGQPLFLLQGFQHAALPDEGGEELELLAL